MIQTGYIREMHLIQSEGSGTIFWKSFPQVTEERGEVILGHRYAKRKDSVPRKNLAPVTEHPGRPKEARMRDWRWERGGIEVKSAVLDLSI